MDRVDEIEEGEKIWTGDGIDKYLDHETTKLFSTLLNH
jgi:hypothetical protein